MELKKNDTPKKRGRKPSGLSSLTRISAGLKNRSRGERGRGRKTRLMETLGHMMISKDLIPLVSEEFRELLSRTDLKPMQIYAAQLFATGMFTVESIARHLGIEGRTIRNWLKNNDFKELVVLTGGDKIVYAEHLVSTMLPLAVMKLVSLLDCDDDNRLVKDVAIELLKGRGVLFGEALRMNTPQDISSIQTDFPVISDEEKKIIAEAMCQALISAHKETRSIDVRCENGSNQYSSEGEEKADQPGGNGGNGGIITEIKPPDTEGDQGPDAGEISKKYLDGKVRF